MNEHEEEYRQVNVRFTEAEIAAVRDVTKVDAIGPAVRAVVLKAVEAAGAGQAARLAPRARDRTPRARDTDAAAE